MTIDDAITAIRAIAKNSGAVGVTLEALALDIEVETANLRAERDELREKVERYEQINWSRVDGGWMAFRKEL